MGSGWDRVKASQAHSLLPVLWRDLGLESLTVSLWVRGCYLIAKVCAKCVRVCVCVGECVRVLSEVRELKQGQAGPASPCHVSALHVSVGTENGWKEPTRTGAVPWPEDL